MKGHKFTYFLRHFDTQWPSNIRLHNASLSPFQIDRTEAKMVKRRTAIITKEANGEAQTHWDTDRLSQNRLKSAQSTSNQRAIRFHWSAVSFRAPHHHHHHHYHCHTVQWQCTKNFYSFPFTRNGCIQTFFMALLSAASPLLLSSASFVSRRSVIMHCLVQISKLISMA